MLGIIQPAAPSHYEDGTQVTDEAIHGILNKVVDSSLRLPAHSRSPRAFSPCDENILFCGWRSQFTNLSPSLCLLTWPFRQALDRRITSKWRNAASENRKKKCKYFLHLNEKNSWKFCTFFIFFHSWHG